MYTECPNCHTTFRVSTAQLKLAEGQVRCGRCDHVFNAVSHLLEDLPGQAGAASVPPVEIIPEAGLEANSIPLAEDMEQTLSEVSIPGMEEELDELAANDLDDMALEESAVADEELVEVDDDIDDDLFSAPAIEDVEGQALGDDFDDSEPVPADGLDGLDLDGDLSDLDMADEVALDEDLELDEEDLGIEDDVAVDALDEPEFAEDDVAISEPSPEDDDLSVDLAEEEKLESIVSEMKDDDSMDDLLADASSPFQASESDLDTAFEASDSTFSPSGMNDSADDYVLRELGENETQSRAWLSTLAWTGVIVILLVVLIGQFVYFKREELVRYPVAKMAIEQMCAVISAYVPCDVPEPKDVSAIQLLERDVRSHPNTKGALLISATVLSSAGFVQAYPSLVLTFSDMNQKTMARRVFQPKEYLKDSAEIEKGMQPETPVRVILEIVDPGPDAVNFEFEFE